jgi:hypothetical protein
MAVRMAISKTKRFEVFKRDLFTCQYCGRTAPNVVLVIDHIEPVAKGGTNDILNLITSCNDCNSGKSARRLSDSTIIEKQMAQLKEIQERRNQLSMLKTWKDECVKFDNEQLQVVVDQIESFYGYSVPDDGIAVIMKAIKKFGIEEVFEAVQVAIQNYELVSTASLKIYGICACNITQKEDPLKANILYARNVLKKRFTRDFVDKSFWACVNAAVFQFNADPLSLIAGAKKVGSFREFIEKVRLFIEGETE